MHKRLIAPRLPISIWALLGILSPLLISFTLEGAEKNLRFDAIVNAEGDPIDLALSLHQDKTGYIYIGTPNGLYVYNGYKYESYVHDSQDPLSISNNWVSSIFEDEQANLWLGTREALNRFHPESGTFTRYKFESPESIGLDMEELNAIVQDENGALWWGVKSGLVKLDVESNTLAHYPNTPFGQVFSLHLDQFGIIWAGTRQNGLFSFDSETEQYEHFAYNADAPGSLSSNTVHSIIEDDEGALWIGTGVRVEDNEAPGSSGLNRFNRATKSFTHFQLAPGSPREKQANDISAITKDSSGKLWMGSSSGDLYAFDPKTSKLTHSTDGHSPATEVTSLLIDQSGIIWVGSRYSHTYSVNPQSLIFTNWNEDPSDPGSLSDGHVTAILEDRQGALWVGTKTGGLNRRNKETNSFTAYSTDNRITALYEDRRGDLWVGASGSGLSVFDRETNTIETQYVNDPNVPTSLAYNRPNVILEDHLDQFWIGHRSGLDLLDRDTGVFTHFRHDPNDPSSITLGSVNCGFEDRTGMLWIGTHGGISVMDPSSGKMRHIEYDSKNPKSLSSNLVRCFHEDLQGTIWVGTDNGLNRYNRDTDTFDRYFAKDGLISNTIWGALEDDSGRMWFSAAEGLSRYDPLTGWFVNYDNASGLQNSYLERSSNFKGADGRFYFGGSNGLDTFQPLELSSALPSTIAVSAIWSSQERLLAWHQLLDTRDIEISSKQHEIAFEFAILDYRDSRKSQYRYRLDGFDDGWVDGGSRNLAKYTNLPPGEYVFHVQGTNSRGPWSEQEAFINLTVTPLFWQTTWFRLALALALVTATYSTHKWITARIRKRNAELREAINEAAIATQATAQLAEKADAANIAKSRFLANMSHEIRTPLNGVMGMLGLLQMTKLDEEQKEISSMADSSARSLLSLLNDILNVSKIEAGEVSLSSVDFAVRPLARETEEILRSKAAEKGLEIRVDIDPKIPDILRGDPGRLRQVLLNLMMNGIKFTEKGSIDLRLIDQGQEAESVSIRFEVADSGIGIPKEQQAGIFNAFSQIDSSNQRKYDGAGLGLSICKQLVNLMGGEIEVKSSDGCGSVFSFTLTLARSESRIQGDLPFDQLEPKEAPIKANGRSTQKHNGERILIVEDNKVNRHVASSILGKLGWDTVLAEDGESCLKQHQPGAFDMILMDCQMPGLDGYETTRRLRKLEPKGERVPIIALTARAMEGDRQKCLDAGMDDYMSKPINPATLERMANKWAFQSPRSRQNSSNLSDS